MTFLEQLQSRRGGLIRLKTELYWYGGRGYDGNPGRVCLILDTATTPIAVHSAGVSTSATATRRTAATGIANLTGYATLLLIDGSPHWVWMAAEDVELL